MAAVPQQKPTSVIRTDRLISEGKNLEVAFVPLEKIHWDKRFREDLGDLEALVESIKDKGVLQPITVTPDFELLAGERRTTAARKAGLQFIPALIRNKEDIIDAREVELLENICRKDFEWSERAALVAEIDALCKARKVEWSGRKTAQLLDRSVGSVAQDLKLAKAIELVPELGDYKTADQAIKVLKKMEEDAIIGELHSRQQLAVASGALQRGIAEMLRIADANYEIGDTFKGLASLRTDGMIDLIECDPPYGIDLNEQKASKDNAASNVHSYNEVEKADYPAFLKKLTKELYRVAKRDSWLIFWFGPTWQREVLESLREAGWAVDEIPGIWVKGHGQTMQPELYLARTYEPFFLARKGRPILVKRGRANVFSYPGVQGNLKYHPTQRPVELIQELIETLLPPGNSIVLCPFLGSGATIRAAYNLGLKVFGWDLNPEYKPKLMLHVENDARKLTEQDDDDGGDTDTD